MLAYRDKSDIDIHSVNKLNKFLKYDLKNNEKLIINTVNNSVNNNPFVSNIARSEDIVFEKRVESVFDDVIVYNVIQSS